MQIGLIQLTFAVSEIGVLCTFHQRRFFSQFAYGSFQIRLASGTDTVNPSVGANCMKSSYPELESSTTTASDSTNPLYFRI